MGNTVTKAHLVTEVAKKTRIKKTQIERVIQGLTEAIGEALIDGNRVAIVGFGSFLPLVRSARKGRDPSTKEIREYPSSLTVKFRPSSVLKEEMNDNSTTNSQKLWVQ